MSVRVSSERSGAEVRSEQLTLERSREGSPPAPKKTFTNAMGIALIVSSYSKPDKVIHGQDKLHDIRPGNSKRGSSGSSQCRQSAWRHTSSGPNSCVKRWSDSTKTVLRTCGLHSKLCEKALSAANASVKPMLGKPTLSVLEAS